MNRLKVETKAMNGHIVKGEETTTESEEAPDLLTDYNRSYTYDDYGNILSKVNAGQTIEYTYDKNNRLIKEKTIKTNETIIKNFSYDPNGNMLSEKSQILTNEAETLGSSLSIKDEHFKIYDYNAYGEFNQSGKDIDNPFTYFGQYYDKETGHYYLRARYYNPSTMRFTQEDTYTGKSNDPLSLNRYLYGLGNPVMFVDPSGYWPDFAGTYSNGKEKLLKVGASVSNQLVKAKDFTNYGIKAIGNTWNSGTKAVSHAIETTYYLSSKSTEDQRKLLNTGKVSPKDYLLYSSDWEYAHFEYREKSNENHELPKLVGKMEITSKNSAWEKLSFNTSKLHQNGKGKPEIKYINLETNQEAVYDGSSEDLILDPRYVGTYNYESINESYSWYEKESGYIEHAIYDVVPYYLVGARNTRDQKVTLRNLYNSTIGAID